MAHMLRQTTRDGLVFSRPGERSIEWRVTTTDGVRLGVVRPNGSRLRGRSWTATDLAGVESRHGSRKSAADHLRNNPSTANKRSES